MLMRKKGKIAILLFIIIFIFLFLGVLSFDYDTKIKIVRKNEESIYFTEKIFNHYILGSRSGGNILKTRILELSKEKAEIEGLLKTEKQNYVVFTERNLVKLYDIDDGRLKTYKVGSDDDKIVSVYVSDIDRDSKDELLIISGKASSNYGESLVIFSVGKELQEIYRRHFKDMNPWKVETADIDGDGIKEISIGVYKRSQFHPIMAKRPFIYNWNENDISPKWRGSRLSRPFEDYIFADIDGDGLDEIVSVEVLENGKKIINSYKWKGFGFEGKAESKEYEEILAIKRVINLGKKDDIAAEVKNKNELQWIILQYTDKGLEIKRKLRDYMLEFEIY